MSERPLMMLTAGWVVANNQTGIIVGWSPTMAGAQILKDKIDREWAHVEAPEYSPLVVKREPDAVQIDA